MMKKEYIVKKNIEIQSILKKNQSTVGKHFIVYKKEDHENKHFRFALSVSKKFGNAVARNQIKRRIRYIIHNMNVVNGYDIFIIVRTSSSLLKFDQIEKELKELFKKANLLEDEDA